MNSNVILDKKMAFLKVSDNIKVDITGNYEPFQINGKWYVIKNGNLIPYKNKVDCESKIMKNQI